MLQSIWILAQANNDDSLNEWLKQNPVALGTIFLVLSVGLIIAGIVNLQTGVTRNKLGMEFRGGIAHFSGWLRILFGIGLAVFSLYKILAG